MQRTRFAPKSVAARQPQLPSGRAGNTARARKLTHRVLVVAAASFFALGALGGCGKKVEPPAAFDTTQPVPPAPLTSSMRLMHTDSTAMDSLHPFRIHDTVHAVIHTDNATDTSRVHAVWKYVQKNATIAENEERLSAGTNDTHFDLINANPWPVGDYELIVSIDGKLRDSVRFPIVPIKGR